MSRNAQGGSTKYQTIVFPKTECSGTSGIPQQIPLPFPSPPFSRSYVIPDPCWPLAFLKQLGQIQTCQIHTHTHFNKLGKNSWYLAQKKQGIPLFCEPRGTTFPCGRTGNVLVTRHREYSFSFHCIQMDTRN